MGFISYCPCCGVRSTEAHSKYADRCVNCGKRYSQYANYKCQIKKGTSKNAQKYLDEIILEYKMLQRCGYKVPKDIMKDR